MYKRVLNFTLSKRVLYSFVSSLMYRVRKKFCPRFLRWYYSKLATLKSTNQVLIWKPSLLPSFWRIVHNTSINIDITVAENQEAVIFCPRGFTIIISRGLHLFQILESMKIAISHKPIMVFGWFKDTYMQFCLKNPNIALILTLDVVK